MSLQRKQLRIDFQVKLFDLLSEVNLTFNAIIFVIYLKPNQLLFCEDALILQTDTKIRRYKLKHGLFSIQYDQW